MRLLFVKLKHIGDALLLTPTLNAVKESYPDATIWVAVRRGSDGILAGCPAIDRVVTSAAPEKSNRSAGDLWEDLRLIGLLRSAHFDYAFELSYGDRGRLLAGLSGAKHRCLNNAVYPPSCFARAAFNEISSFDWRERHQVEAAFFTVANHLSLQMASPPPLVFDRAATRPCDLGVILEDYVVMHPGTRWLRKRWPMERWIPTGRFLLERAAHLVISVGPDPVETELGVELAKALGPRAVATHGRLSWAQLAGLLYGAKLFVGLDTAAMHLAAACQCPVVALFGASVAQHWRPWAVVHRLVGAELRPGEKGSEEGMKRIGAADVVKACGALLTFEPRL